jgi:hypothetical protein
MTGAEAIPSGGMGMGDRLDRAGRADRKGPAGWAELRVRPDTAPLDSVLLAAAPFTEGLRERGVATRSFFLRDREGLRLRFEAGDSGGVRPAALAEQLRLAGCGAVVTDGNPQIELTDAPFEGPGAGALVTDFLSDVSELLLDCVRAAAGDEAVRLALALDLMVAHLPAVAFSEHAGTTRQLPKAFLSLRSHADGFFIMSRDPEAARAAMERRYQGQAPRINERAAAVLDQLQGIGPVVSEVAAGWYPRVRPYLARIQDAYRSGDLTSPAYGMTGYLGDTRDIGVSRFHQAVREDTRFQRFMRDDPVFQAMRILMGLLYLALHCVGLPLIERYFLCHSVSRACEALFGVEAPAVFRDVSAFLTAPPEAP